MLDKLGKIIEKRPAAIIITIILITLLLSTLLPQIEMKTEFEDFMPKEDVVEASDRVTDYFGQNIQTMFLYAETQNAESTLSINAIREQYSIEQNLKDKPEIDSTISITTFIDQVCFMQYGKTIEQCTNDELETVLEDMLFGKKTDETKILTEDDPNEEKDYSLFPKIFKGRSKDSIDIKNGYASYDNETISFKIEVYDLSKLNQDLKPPLSFVNTIEWYVNFKNMITLDESLDIDYKISAHIEPKHPLWVLGEGFFPNLKNIFQNIKQKEFLNTYEKTVYLWMKPPGQEMYFPVPLKTGEINFDKQNDFIEINVQREEIGKYGIATSFGGFELPTKLNNFKIGCRHYKNPLGLPWSRISANSSYLFQQIENLENKPLLKDIANSLFQRYAGMSYQEIIDFLPNIDQSIPVADRLALKDIENSWTTTDQSENEENILFIRPRFYDDLKLSSDGFVSTDATPQASLVILQLNRTTGFEENLERTKKILNYLEDYDRDYTYISMEATSDGVISKDINEITSESNQFIGPAIFIIIVIILFFVFRKVSYIVLPMIALVISTIWLFGSLVLMGMTFSVMQVALIPLVLGLGVDYSVHLFHNYKTELEEGKTPAEAIKKSVLEIGNAMFLAMLTTVIAFMSFFASSVPALKDFGILLGLGVLYTFITAITILPATRYLLDRKKEKIKPKKQSIFDVSFLMKKVSRFVLRYNKIIVVVMLLLSVLLAVGGSQLETGFDMNEFAPEDTPSIELFEKIGKNFPSSSQDQEYILIEGNVATVDTLEGIKKTHENFEDDTFIAKNPDGSLKTQSLYTVIKESIEENNSLIDTFNINSQTGIPKTDRDVENLLNHLYSKESISFEEIDMENIDMQSMQNQDFKMDNTGAQVKSVLHKDESNFDATVIRVYIGGNANNGDADQKADDILEKLKKELTNDVEDYGEAEATVTGQYIITLTITNSLTDSQVLSTVISLVLAAIVLILAYRNPLLGLIALIPVGITMIWILGTMYFIGYSLNALTITITSITIGIGIDYSIHATERFRLVADKTGDIKKAMCETISHTGGALLTAALTTACGFGILALAPMPPQQQFGVILSITIVFSLLTSILVLPSVLVYWAKGRKKRKGYIVTTNGMKKINGKWIKNSGINKEEINDDYCDR